MDEILKCDQSNESCRAALLCGIVYNAVQGSSNFLSLWMNSSSVTTEMKATEQYLPLALFIMLYEVVLI